MKREEEVMLLGKLCKTVILCEVFLSTAQLADVSVLLASTKVLEVLDTVRLLLHTEIK